jgi:hypothetical protein
MIILDRLLIGGFTFVLRRIAEAVDAQLDDVEVVREELLAAQMRRELGEIDDDAFAAIERELLGRLRAIRERAGEATGSSLAGLRIVGVEASVAGEESGVEASPGATAALAATPPAVPAPAARPSARIRRRRSRPR